MEIARFYTEAFFNDCKKLNIKYPDVVQPATGMIESYIKVISSWWKRATPILRGAMFILTPPSWSTIMCSTTTTRRTWPLASVRVVEEDLNKRNKNDFVLWFTKVQV